MNKEQEYIKEMFEKDGVKAPDSLSEENMLAMLNAAGEKQQEAPAEKNYEPVRTKKRPSLKKWMSAAAVVIVAVLGIGGIRAALTAPPDTSLSGDELYTFKSESEIKRLIGSLEGDHGHGRVLMGLGSDGEIIEYESNMVEDSASDTGPASRPVTAKSTGSTSHSDTYLQVEEVDEADIVKTDGKYIYYVTDSREVVILSAKNGKTKRLSTIGNNGIENYIDDIYLKGDKIITVGTFYKDDSDEPYSGIVVYDISDRSKPEVLYDFSQTGSILSSRMVGDFVYLVTNDYVYKGGRTLPLCGSSDDLRSLGAAEISCVPDPRNSSYIVLSAIDVSSGKRGISATKAVFGASEEIYCNDHNLYCTSSEWPDDSNTIYTRIVRASLDGLKVKVDRTTTVRGYVDSRFSMDERDGYFRIATTSERGGIDVNNLYVLDSVLKEAGKVTGFARNESIKAVRYIGDKAYVITYEAIDPLFIIDLSDPADPRIEGEVKIDGFSTLLIPVSDDRLLGIGHATGDNGYGGEYDSGLKLALFDISNPSEPKVLDSKEFRDMSSPAQYDHHALMVNSSEGYFAIPYEVWSYPDAGDDIFVEDEAEENAGDGTDDSYDAGVLLFTAGDDIGAVDKHSLGSSAINRSVYIGDWVYALDAEGNVQSFKPSL